MQHHHYWKRANYLHKAGMYEAALPLWRIIHQDLPTVASPQLAFDVNYKLGDCYDETDQPAKALPYYFSARRYALQYDEDLALLIGCGVANTAFRCEEYEIGETHLKIVWPDLPEAGMLTEAFNLAKGVVSYDEGLAFQLFQEVLTAALEYEDIEVLEVAYEVVAGHLLREKRFTDALEVGAKVKGRLEDPDYVNQPIFHELEVHAQRRDGEAFISCYDREIPLLPYSSNAHLVTNCLRHYYAGVRELFKGASAEKYFASAIATAKDDEGYRLEILEKCYQENAEFYRYEEAKLLAVEALALARSLDISYPILDVSIDYATILYSNNEAAIAQNILLASEDGVLEEQDPELTLRLYALLTRCAHQLGDSSGFERSSQAWQEVGKDLHPDEAFDFYFEFAQILAGIGQVERADEYLSTARTIATNTDRAHHLPRVDKERAMFAFQLGHFERSLEILKGLTQPSDDPNFTIDYLLLRANVEGDLGQDKVAEELYRKAIVIASQYPELEHHLSPAFCNLGLLFHARKAYAEAEDFYRRGLEIDRALNIKNYELTSLHNLGALYLDQGRFAMAETILWDALAILGQLYGANEASGGRKFTSDEWMNTVEMLAEVLVNLNKPKLALRLLVHRRSVQSGLTQGAVAKLPLPLIAPGELLISFSGLRRDSLHLLTLDEEGDIRHRQIELKEDASLSDNLSLAQRVKAYQDKQSRRKGRGVKRYLTDWPWLVSYFNSLCDLTPEQSRRATIRRRDALALHIAEHLVWPALELTDSKPTSLLLQPDYSLGLVPFAALPGPGGQAPLIANFNIQLLAGVRADATKTSSSRILVLGNTDYSATESTDYPLASLNGAVREKEILAQTFPKGMHLVNSPAEALQPLLDDTMALSTYRYIHYLGHADADAHNGAGVLFFPQLVGGVLPAAAFSRHQLRAELVYLAACSTGAGRTYAGWGIDSLGKTFLDAGAANVITTLWPLRDSMGPKIVQQLYPLLDEHNPSTALAQVQRMFLRNRMEEDTQDFYFWGGLCAWGWR